MNADVLELFLAAVRAVAPEALADDRGAPPARAAGTVIESLSRADPLAAQVLQRLTDDQRADVGYVLDGMLRARAAEP